MTEAQPRRFPPCARAIAAGLMFLIGIWPLVPFVLAAIAAEWADCMVDGTSPCMIAGADRGPLLYQMTHLFWLFYVTQTFALIGGIWLVVEGVLAIARGKPSARR